MKKLSLILLGALAATQAAQAAPGSFNGFYLGGQLGWTQRNDKTSFPIVKVGRSEFPGVNKSKNINGLSYGVYVGYGQNNCGFYWGGEFGIGHDTINKSAQNKVIPKINGRDSTIFEVALETKYNRGVVFGFNPRIGAVIANENLLYVKLGMELSSDKVTSKFTVTEDGNARKDPLSNSEVTKTQFVFVPGFGYERAFGNLLARVEYGYNIGSKVKGSKHISVAENSISNIKYTAHTVKCGLAYKF